MIHVLFNIIVLSTLLSDVALGISYTPHEQRFYKTQAKYIKNNWKKIIKNESEAFVELDRLINLSEDIESIVIDLKRCSNLNSCLKTVKNMDSILKNIDFQVFTLLLKLADTNLSAIQKNTNSYMLFIKKISDINRLSTEGRLLLNKVKYYIATPENPKKDDLPDIINIFDNIYFEIKTISQIALNKNAKELLIFGENEFISQLNKSIKSSSLDKYHQLDKAFNVMNRDLQKNKDLISNNSKNLLLQIHRRWNAILKIIKRK